MKIVVAHPPNIDAIRKVFPCDKPGVIFTWGDTIFNPSGSALTPDLIRHEEVHAFRQTNDIPSIEQWWVQYMADPEFRLREELPAHQAEYQSFCGRVLDRNQRRKFLVGIAHRLAGPLYGGLISPSQASKRIEGIR